LVGRRHESKSEKKIDQKEGGWEKEGKEVVAGGKRDPVWLEKGQSSRRGVIALSRENPRKS